MADLVNIVFLDAGVAPVISQRVVGENILNLRQNTVPVFFVFRWNKPNSNVLNKYKLLFYIPAFLFYYSVRFFFILISAFK